MPTDEQLSESRRDSYGNVFVLTTGRSGSTTFIRACEHIENYSAAHESRISAMGAERLAYPIAHIEADNRLAWFLGRLDRAYGKDSFYVHLRRDSDAVARSFADRSGMEIMRAYRREMLWDVPSSVDAIDVAADYVETVDSNIELFLRDKPNSMIFRLEEATRHFPAFWRLIGAVGDLDAALAEFDTKHNAKPELSLSEHAASLALVACRGGSEQREGVRRDAPAIMMRQSVHSNERAGSDAFQVPRLARHDRHRA